MKRFVGSMIGVVVVLLAATSGAQERERIVIHGDRLAAPHDALEITVGTGYTQGFGSLNDGNVVGDVTGAGLGIDLGLGYRLNPYWQIGVSGEYQQMNALRVSATRGVSGTIEGQVHFAPYQHLDPYLELGAGYRGLYQDTGVGNVNIQTHGIELGRVRFGLDVRVSEDVALGPVVGADTTLWAWQNTSNTPNSNVLTNPTIASFVFAGVQGRFDVGGPRTLPSSTTVVTAAPLDSP